VYPIDLFRRWLFPKVFFSLGKQKETMKWIQQWRKWIGGVMTMFGVGWIIKILFY